ncbi:C40 family peptidase [Paraburkholderia dinghuensis]|uniref:Peptidoglycan endopeptidase n=1 Tax=Paraburkholderia dinghuensis TaxID=2305225 RepID=A0A3N6MTX8_9BURK|nr:C40 family peptidase [Paraburkholderia dinghuensis]RQH07444.1 peptidoglycan endopeptidase [Paraburkholderia dinghuensis]
MRRLWLPLLIVVFLAACSSTPDRVARSGSSSTGSDALRTRPPGLPNFVDHSIGREEISIQAMGLVGIPYRWGGNTPDSGFDCSGLVKYVLARSASVSLPRTTAEMSERGQSIDPGEIAAGDLVFFNTTGRPHSHVGIYVGNLRFVNAPSTGGTVRLDYLTNSYWAKRFDGIRRMAPPRNAPAPFDTPTWEASAPVQHPATVATATAVEQSRPMPTAPSAPASPPAPAVADAFEPPPAALSTAHVQARSAGAVTPAVAPSTSIATGSGGATPGPIANASTPAVPSQPDPINATADAFEPPPPAAIAAARQAAQAGSVSVTPPASSTQPAPFVRASTTIGAPRAPAQTIDDPIARFANSAF